MNSKLVGLSLIPREFTLILQRSLIPLSLSEAREEFGNEVASKLKLTKDGRIVLWPQPSDDPEDPQNVCLSVSSEIHD
jgi:hypothetical protein